MGGLNKSPMRIFIAFSVISFSFFFSSLLLDRVLGVLGWPQEVFQSVTYAPYFKEIRKNIEFAYAFQANQRGYRSPDISLAKPNGTKRIFVAGDSFVEGVGIEEGARFVDHLEKRIQSSQYHLEWINGGLRGTGPEGYGNGFLFKGLGYSPDGLIICVFANDVTDSPTNLTALKLTPKFPRHSKKRKVLHTLWPSTYMLVSEFFQNKQMRKNRVPYNFFKHITQRAKKSGISSIRIEQWRKSIPENIIQASMEGKFNVSILAMGLVRPWYWTDSLDINTERAKLKAKVFFNHLDVILEKARQVHVEVALVYIPTRYQYDPSSHDSARLAIKTGTVLNPTWLKKKSQLEKKLEDWSESHKIPFLNLTPLFRDLPVEKGDLTYYYDGHWTPKGHDQAARFIETWLKTVAVFSFM